jgi:hypothetical protein
MSGYFHEHFEVLGEWIVSESAMLLWRFVGCEVQPLEIERFGGRPPLSCGFIIAQNLAFCIACEV